MKIILMKITESDETKLFKKENLIKMLLEGI